MRDHTVFAVVLLVFAVGFYSFTSGSPTGQMFGAYTVGEYYNPDDGPVYTYRYDKFESDNNYPLLGNPIRVNSMYEGKEITLPRTVITDCIERALKNANNRATFREAELQYTRANVCKGVDPADLDLNGDGYLSYQDTAIAEAHYSLSAYSKSEKNRINTELYCGYGNRGKIIFFDGEYQTCSNLKGSPGFQFLTQDFWAYN